MQQLQHFRLLRTHTNSKFVYVESVADFVESIIKHFKLITAQFHCHSISINPFRVHTRLLLT